VHLTSVGEFVANHVLRAEALLAQTAVGVAEFRNGASGSLAIVASWVTGTYLLPEIMAEFQHSHPAVRITLELRTAVKAVEWLRSHHAELGFIAGVVGGPEIEAEPLLENEIVIVGRPTLVPSRPSRENLESLAWISREEGSATRAASDQSLARLGIVPHRRFELPSYEAVLHALKKSYGIAAISRFVVAEALRSGSLGVVAVRGWNVSSMISVLRVRHALLTPSANQFQRFVRKRFGEISRERGLEEHRW
jgi:DNA-binding transcriptional LysR family regulator